MKIPRWLAILARTAVMSAILVSCVGETTHNLTGSVGVVTLYSMNLKLDSWCEDNRPDLCDADRVTGGVGYLEPDEESEVIEEFMSAVLGTDCSDGWGSFREIQRGASVLVLDGAGEIIAKTTLGNGTFVEGVNVSRTACVFEFATEVEAADFYTIEIANRDGPVWSFEELDSMGWNVGLSLVDDS